MTSWSSATKHSTSWSNATKNSPTWANQSLSDAPPQAKYGTGTYGHSVYGNVRSSTTTWTNQTKN